MKCPNCGAVNPAHENFCEECGAHLDAPVDTRVENLSDVPAAASTSTVASDTFLTSTSGESENATTHGSRTLVPNAQLQSGRYVVEKVLGEGGMGAAVLARDTRVSNKQVVIKELIAENNADSERRQEDVRNFQHEVATLAKLDHPLIPSVTDSFQEGTRYYMVQEYAAGENLEAHLDRVHKPLPEQEVLTYASQVLDILHYLAQQHPPIVHRDIKPANIIIGRKDSLAHLVDFGIARADEAKHAQRKQTTALGTPGYAPPEQYRGNADTRSDLYALAATMHHLLTNQDPRDQPPFQYPPVRSLNPQLSAEIERVLERALTLDISKRYQSALDMKQDLDEILHDRFQTAGDAGTGIYLRGTTGPMSRLPPAATQRPSQPAAERPPGLYPLSPSHESYPDISSRGPTYIRAWDTKAWKEDTDPELSAAGREGRFRQQQIQRQIQQERPAYIPPVTQQTPILQANNYLLFSFIMLVVVLAIIVAALFFLPFLAGL